jgi:Tol biopolymer transport system component
VNNKPKGMHRLWLMGILLWGIMVSVILLAKVLGQGMHSEVLAFSSNRDGNWEVYLLDVAQRVAVNLTHHPSDDLTPAWSPDGRLAFETNRDGNREIYLLNMDGMQTQNATNSPSNETFPAWSIDGQLSFVSYIDGDADVYQLDSLREYWLNMTSDSAASDHPAWSNDDQLAFDSNRNGAWRIHVMNTFDATEQNVRGSFEERQYDPTWSPDSQWLAFQSIYNQQADIYLINLANGEIQQLTNDSATDSEPSWSLDGRSLAFSSSRDGNEEIYIMDMDSRDVQRLTFDSAMDSQPAWMP